MKKIIATIAAFTMAFALCSCGRSADSEPAAVQPSEVTTAATAETAADTAAVTTAPQSEPTTTTTAKGEPTTTTTAESETTTPENTTTAETTTTSDSATTTAAKQTADENKPAAVPNKDTPAENKTPTANPTTEPNKPAAKPATTTKRVWTRELTTEEYWSLDWEEQRDYNQWLLEEYYPSLTTTPPKVNKTDSELADEMFAAVNEERINAGLEPLVLDPWIKECAMTRAEEDVVYHCLAHYRPDGSPFYSIFNEPLPDGTVYYMNGYFGECLGGGDPYDTSCFAKGLMTSPPHRDIMLNPNAKLGAVGYYDYEKIGYPGTGGTAILLVVEGYSEHSQVIYN